MNKWLSLADKQSTSVARRDFLCAADDLGLILVTGADATLFLHNQLSNDIHQITEGRYQLSSFSTPKGRMLGIFRIIRISNGYILVTPRSMVSNLLQQLYHFIVQADVSLADASDHFARIAVQTNKPELAGHSLLPKNIGEVMQNDSVISMQLEMNGDQQRYLLMFLSEDEAINSWQDLAATLEIAGFSSWRLSEIDAGIPVIYPQTSEEFVLQMANLGFLDGVSFKKGCYPGQEIVARMQYLGKLKRRMFLAQLATSQLPAPGDELTTSGKTEADGSGKIVDAAFVDDGICHCLYIAQIAKAESGNLQLLKQPEIKITNLDLPYSVEN